MSLEYIWDLVQKDLIVTKWALCIFSHMNIFNIVDFWNFTESLRFESLKKVLFDPRDFVFMGYFLIRKKRKMCTNCSLRSLVLFFHRNTLRNTACTIIIVNSHCTKRDEKPRENPHASKQSWIVSLLMKTETPIFWADFKSLNFYAYEQRISTRPY